MGKGFHHMLRRRRGRRGFSGTTWAGRGGGGGAHTSPVSHSRWEGELEIKIGGLLAGDQFLFYPELVLLTALVQPAQGGSGVLSSPRNDPRGDEGSQHPAPHRGAPSLAGLRGHIQPKGLRDPQHKIKKEKSSFSGDSIQHGRMETLSETQAPDPTPLQQLWQN